MKRVQLRRDLPTGNEKLASADILRMVAGSSPTRAITIDEMRRRCRILDALDTLTHDVDSIILEDEDAKVLVAALESFPWSAANRSLLTIIDDVLQAETVPVPMKLVDPGLRRE